MNQPSQPSLATVIHASLRIMQRTANTFYQLTSIDLKRNSATVFTSKCSLCRYTTSLFHPPSAVECDLPCLCRTGKCFSTPHNFDTGILRHDTPKLSARLRILGYKRSPCTCTSTAVIRECWIKSESARTRS